MNNDNKIYCPRCGNEMNSNSRYCMKCGYLNAENEANQGLRSYIPKEQTSSYQIGNGEIIYQDSDEITTAIASNAGNSTICFIVNFIIYIAIMISGFIFSMDGLSISLENIKISTFPYVALINSVAFLFIYSLQLIFIKCNKKWWSVFIPVYNLMILGEITFKRKWVGLLSLIPVVGQVLFLVMLYVLGTKFKYNGLLTMLFSPIFIPIIGFGTRFYEGVNYVDHTDTLENDYGRKKLFLTLIIIFIVFGLLLILWNNIIETRSKAKKLTNYYFVMASSRLINKTKELANTNYLDCDDYEYRDNKGIYYIYYSDISKNVYIPFNYLRSPISGYVIIDNNDNKYYISLSDGTYGFDKTLSSKVNINTIVKYKKIDIKDRNTVNYCVIRRPRLSIE